VPQDEWNKLVAEIEGREKMKAEGNVVRDLGGLHVIGTERHEARRIDLQLRGTLRPAGRSRLVAILPVVGRRPDADLRRRVGEKRAHSARHAGREAIESRMVSRRIEGAQKKVEERNFEIRKNLLEYDEVMDEQRKRVYGFRQQLLDGVNCKYVILDMINKLVERRLDEILDRDYGTTTYAVWGRTDSRRRTGSRRLPRSRRPRRRALGPRRSPASDRNPIARRDRRNLPDGEDESEWDWEALAKFVDTRWSLNLRDRDLRRSARIMWRNF